MSFKDAPGHPKRRLIVTIVVLGLMAIGVFVALSSVLNAPEGGVAGEAEELIEGKRAEVPDASKLGGPDTDQPVAATVVMKSTMQFEPRSVTIQPGQSVRWINDTNFQHTVTLEPAEAADEADVRVPEGAATFSSDELGYHEAFVHTFEVPGLYRYFCKMHEMKGMIGEVVVEDVPGAARLDTGGRDVSNDSNDDYEGGPNGGG